MRLCTSLTVAALTLAAGCAPTMEPAAQAGTVGNLPEAVVNLAAPNQDLSTARRLAEDGCYWYEHSGPVETTLVPLRAEGGRPICTRAS